MKNIKPVPQYTEEGDKGYFNPYEMTKDEDGNVVYPNSNGVYTPRCICGYELIKESDDTWRCTGGSHRYLIREMKMMKDKFGNTVIMLPLPEQESKNDKNKK